MSGEVRITARAYAELLAEVRRVSRNVETGGIFVGLPERNLITRFLAAGAESRRSYGHFVRAASDVQALLDEAASRGEEYMGEAHVHPDSVEGPSGTDVRTMQGIVGTGGYGVQRALLGIAVRRDTIEGPTAAALRLFRFDHAGGSWGEVAWTVVGAAHSAKYIPVVLPPTPRPALAAPSAIGRVRRWLANTWVRLRPGAQLDFWSALASRQSPVLSVQHLREKRVLLIGAGSLGSQVANHLVRAGVGTFTVIDGDRVAPENLGRTTYLPRHVGRLKAAALAAQLREINPSVAVAAIAARTDDLADEKVAALLEQHDVLVDATGSPSSKFRVNALARDRVPAVYAAAHRRAETGEVVFVLPGQTPCWECAFGQVRRAQPASLQRSLDYTTPGELAAEPALGPDIGFIAIAVAKGALALLAQGTESQTAKFFDAKSPILFLGSAPAWIFSGQGYRSAWAACGRSSLCSCQRKDGGPIALETGEDLPAA